MKGWLAGLVCAAALACAAGPAPAHEVRPAYLEVRETAPDAYIVAWKQPVSGEQRLVLRPEFPATCTRAGDATLEAAGASVVERWRMRCPGGLRGQKVRIAGLERTLTSVYVSVTARDGKQTDTLVSPASPEAPLGGAAAPALLRYVRLGVEHILGGVDHLAFVAGLVLLAAGVRGLLLALTAFTLAHSLTLAASALGLFGLPGKPVEACIALSILLVGYESVRLSRGQHGLAAQKPWLIAFAFGLLHGFGFAGALADIGLPDKARIAALLLFNVGVEIGQLIVVALLLAGLWAAREGGLDRGRVRLAAGYALGIFGAYWLIERLGAAFLPA